MVVPGFLHRSRWARGLAALASAASWLVAGCADGGREAGRTILIDGIHSVKRAPEQPLEWHDYAYVSVHGHKKLFDFLNANGYAHRYVTRAETMELTPAVLRDADILLVDLIALHCLDFRPEEIDAVRRFVARGGGLLVVVDHTNVYDHARRSNALLAPFGVRTLYSTAIDRPPHPDWEDVFWVVVRAFADHPVTRGVRAVFLGTGAPLATEHGVAFLSEHGFADAWMPERKHLSLVGNGVLDAGEETGALPVVAAGEHGRGRFVVLGDENMMGNSRLLLGDNFELVANVIEWLARDEGAEPPLRERLAAPLRVGFDLEHGAWNIAGNGCEAYLPFFIDFNRGAGVVARGLVRLEGRWDVLVFTDPLRPLAASDLAFVRAHLAAGGTVVLLTDVVRARPGSRQLLQELLPEVVLVGRRAFGAGALPAGADLVDTVLGAEEFPVVSGTLAVAGLRVAGHEYPPGSRCAFDLAASRPYLRRLTASGGEPLLGARAGDQLVDLARTYSVGGGRLIVFFQDGPFRNETLGWELLPASARNEGSHRVVQEFVRWLRSLHGAGGDASGSAAATP